jgi:hypothetical protein
MGEKMAFFCSILCPKLFKAFQANTIFWRKLANIADWPPIVQNVFTAIALYLNIDGSAKPGWHKQPKLQKLDPFFASVKKR